MFSRPANTMSMVSKRFEASLMDHSKSKNLHTTQKMKNFKKAKRTKLWIFISGVSLVEAARS